MSFGSEAIKLLAQYEVDTIFGIPGVHTIEYYRGVSQSGLTPIVPRHEQGAGFMADGYTRISGKPGVCVLVSGPGVINAATPIAQAWHDSIPMLIIAASTESSLRGRNRGPLHDVPDQAKIFDQLTFLSKTVTTPDEFAEAVAQTFHSWQTQRPRPVHISVPTDLLEMDSPEIQRVSISGSAPTASMEEISQVVRAIQDSVRPLVIAGGGALKASAEILSIINKIGAPVITTGNARGLIPHDHPLNVGTLMPFKAVQELIQSSDLVIAIGTEFSDVDIIYTGKRLPQPKKLVRVDIDPTQLQTGLSAWLGITSDAKSFASALDRALTSAAVTPVYLSAPADVQQARGAVSWTAQSISHFPWLDAINESLPHDAIVSIDSTQLAYTAHHYLPWSKAGDWLAPYGLGTLGPALPMALGAKVAAPNRPVLVIAGDGGFLFTIQELATARDIGGNLVIIIWDNAGYGEIRDSFDRAKAPHTGVDVHTYDLVMVAKGFGLQAHRITTPDQLSQQMKIAFHSSSPTVLVVTEPGSKAAL